MGTPVTIDRAGHFVKGWSRANEAYDRGGSSITACRIGLDDDSPDPEYETPSMRQLRAAVVTHIALCSSLRADQALASVKAAQLYVLPTGLLPALELAAMRAVTTVRLQLVTVDVERPLLLIDARDELLEGVEAVRTATLLSREVCLDYYVGPSERLGRDVVGSIQSTVALAWPALQHLIEHATTKTELPRTDRRTRSLYVSRIRRRPDIHVIDHRRPTYIAARECLPARILTKHVISHAYDVRPHDRLLIRTADCDRTPDELRLVGYEVFAAGEVPPAIIELASMRLGKSGLPRDIEIPTDAWCAIKIVRIPQQTRCADKPRDPRPAAHVIA